MIPRFWPSEDNLTRLFALYASIKKASFCMRKGEDHDVVVEKIINLYRQLKNTIYLACKIKHFLFLIFQRPYTYMYIIKWINRICIRRDSMHILLYQIIHFDFRSSEHKIASQELIGFLSTTTIASRCLVGHTEICKTRFSWSKLLA